MIKAEWLDWKSNPVTIAFHEACLERIEEGKDILFSSAGLDSNKDNFMRGFIQAYREMLDFRVEDYEE